ncbi:MAG: hypothetical protein ACTSP4_01180 [Candidatus Hodarchaeales archaeon]
MESRLKIFGPGIVEALLQLDKLSLECEDLVRGSHVTLTEEISSKKGVLKFLKRGKTKVGTYDYSFFWQEPPSFEDIKSLIGKIDDKLVRTKARYTITTTEIPGELTDFDLREDSAVSVVKFIGPSILKAITKLDEESDNIPEIITSKSLGKGIITIGEFDYSWSWGRYPTVDDIRQVIAKIDTILQDTGVNYTITTLGKMKREEKVPEEAFQKAYRKSIGKKVLKDHRV